MNDSDIDNALRELAATRLPPAPDLRTDVRRAIAQRSVVTDGRNDSIFGEGFSLRWLAGHPFAAAAILAASILPGVAGSAFAPAAQPATSQRQAARALHLDSFTTRQDLATGTLLSQPSKER
jgi:hypothetical protein